MGRRNPFDRSFHRLVCCVAFVAGVACLAILQSAGAQNGPRRGSRSSPTSSGDIFRVLADQKMVAELELTESQKTRIRELDGQRSFYRSKEYEPFKKQLVAADTDAEKQQVREDIASAAKKHREAIAEQAQNVLTEEQQGRLRQLRWHRAGSDALLRDDVISALNISDEQRKQLEDIQQQRRTSWRNIDRRKRYQPETVQTFRKTWEAKTLAVLTPAQRTQWKELLGPPPSWKRMAKTEAAASDAGPTKSTGTRSGTTNAAAVNSKDTNTAAADSNGKYVASFDAPPGHAGGTSSSQQPKTNFGTKSTASHGSSTGREQATLSFNFENAPWKVVLEYFAQKTGLTLDASEVPAGTFSFRDESRYTPTEALDVINGYLLTKNFILVRRDKFLVVHNLANPVPQSIIPDVSVDELPHRGRNELMRVTFTIDPHADVKETANEVAELQGPHGKTVSFATAHRLVVTDIGGNLLRIARILKDVSPPENLDDLAFRAFQLKHIPASEAEKVLTQQLNASRTVRNVSAGGSSNDRRREFYRRMMRSRFGRGRSRGGSSNGSNSSSSGTSTQTTGEEDVRVTSDPRTNNVLVFASAAKVKIAEQIIQSIDVPLNGENRFSEQMRNNTPYFKVYRVTKVDSREVTKTLTALMNPESVINEDAGNGTIHIMGTPDEHQMAEELIRQMDGGGTGGQSLDVIPLNGLDPVAVANTLKAMFINEDADSAPTIEADVAGRRLLVKGSQGQIEQIRSLVGKLDSNRGGTAVAGRGQTGTVRRLPVPGGDPERFLQTLRQLWSEANPSNPIRVVPLNNSNPIRERKTPSGRRLQSPGFQPTGVESRRTQTDNLRTRRSLQRTGFLPENDRASRQLREPRGDDAPRSDTRLRNERDDGPQPDISQHRRNNTGDRQLAYYIPGQPLVPRSRRSRFPGTSFEAGESSFGDSGDDSRNAAKKKPSGNGKPAKKGDIGRTRDADTQTKSNRAPDTGNTNHSDTANDDGKKTPNDDQPAPISIMIRDGQLVLISDDKQALDRLQKIIALLAETMPQKTRWTVFYLQAADCTQAATMLEQLFPTSSVATVAADNTSLMGSLTGGIQQMGSSLMDLSGLNSLGTTNSLRIIPEVRSNALFVSGPPSKVRDVEQVLRVLDASDLPANMRDRTPRMIPVRYADVNEVANIIRDVYSDYMQSAGDRGSGRNRSRNLALALLSGRNGGNNGRRGGNTRQQQNVRLTLGVDERTGQLVVSADDALFKQVEALVIELDRSAYDGRRTTRVVQLENTSPSVITQTLTSMYPNVTVSGTTTSTSSNQGNNNRSGNGSRSRGNDDNDRMERIRQFMRMRRTMQQQNGDDGRSGARNTRGARGNGGENGARPRFNFGGRRPSGRRGSGRGGRFGGRRGR